jgi:hypothetical protein
MGANLNAADWETASRLVGRNLATCPIWARNYVATVSLKPGSSNSSSVVASLKRPDPREAGLEDGVVYEYAPIADKFDPHHFIVEEIIPQPE